MKANMAQSHLPDSSLFLLPPLDTLKCSIHASHDMCESSLGLPDRASVRHTHKTRALYTTSPANLALSLQMKGGGGDK